MKHNVGWGGSFLHASLAVEDLGLALEFYTRVFRARVIFQEFGMSDLIRRTTGLSDVTCDLAQLEFNGIPPLLELIAFHDVPRGQEDHAPVRFGHGHICFGTMEFDLALTSCLNNGAEPVGEVVLYPEGRAVYLREPGGSVIELEDTAK